MHTTDECLARLRRHATKARAQAAIRDTNRLLLILEAQDAGAGRRDIAAALGISRQALDRYLRRRGQ